MKYLSLFFLTFGEWVEANIVGVVTVAVGWIITAAGALRWFTHLEASTQETSNKVDALTKAFTLHADDLHDHTRDTNVHTTFEQRQAINARFDKLEASMERGHSTIEGKVDRLMEMVHRGK